MATGSADEFGFYTYGEDDLADPGQGFSELLNKSTEGVKKAVPTLVYNQVKRELHDDGTIRAAAITGVQEAAANYDFTTELGFEKAHVTDTRARAIFAFEDDGAPIIINEDGYMTTEELDTAYDIYEPGARGIWLYEDDSIGGVIYDDGTFIPGAGTALDTIYILGDSLSWEADLAAADVAKGWTYGLADSTGRATKKYGRPGARTAELAWMAGASLITGTINGGRAVTSFTVTGLSTNPFRAGDAPAVPVIGMLDDRTMVRGQLTRNGSTAATFTADLPIDRASTSIQLRSIAIPQDATLIFDAGTNDGPTPGGGATANEVSAAIISVIDSRNGPTVVWSPLDRGASEGNGTARGTFIRDIETAIATQRPRSWMPARDYLASEQAFTDAVKFDPAFTPTADDLSAVAAGAIPPSFRVIGGTNGSVHPNVLGHALLLWFMLNHLFTKGLA